MNFNKSTNKNYYKKYKNGKKSISHNLFKKKKRKTYKLSGGILPKLARQTLLSSDISVYNLPIKILDNRIKLNLEDGIYDFIILNKEPDTVYLFKSPNSIYGHTSLNIINNDIYLEELKNFKTTQRKTNNIDDQVKYAGEFLIENNLLKEWNNKSGHYTPLIIEADNTGLPMNIFTGIKGTWAQLFFKN